MTYTHTAHTGLPDPDMDSRFYENVPSRRLLAWVFDGVITFAITLLLSTVSFGIGFFIFPFVWLVVGFVYRSMTIATGSATWGMRIVGIEFRDRDGEKLSAVLALAHTAIFTFGSGVMILQLVSIGLILGSRYGQSLQDMILGTTAINRPEQVL